MAINNNFSVSQQNYQTMLRKEVSTVSTSQAQNLAQTTKTGATKEAEKNQGANEMSHLSEAAQKAMEAELLKDAENQGKSANAGGQVGQQQTKGLRKKDEESFDNKGFGPGEHEQEVKPGFVLVEGATPEEDYQIREADANKLTRLDAPSNWKEKVLGDMPDQSRVPAEAMIKSQLDTAGPKKVSKFKEGNSKFVDSIEGMDLELAEPAKKAGSRPAPIRSAKNEKPLMLEDTASADLAKRAAADQLASGGGQSEAFVA